MVERGASDPPPEANRAVLRYIATTCMVACGLLITLFCLQVGRIQWASTTMAPCYVFMGLLVLAELKPLVVARGDGTADRITVSTTFAVTLSLISPVCLAMAAQGVAVVIDDLHRRRSPLRAAFNFGQYALTIAAARAVYALTSDHPFLQPTASFQPRDFVPALAAGLGYLLVNNVAVAGVIAVSGGPRMRATLREDVRVQGITSAILIGLAPVAAVLAGFFLPMVPLVLLPLLGVQHNAWIAARRQHDALHDGLTGLANRTLFMIKAEAALDSVRADERCVGVMLIDLDHFKEVNDTLGHSVGDGLLREVAARLSAALPDDVTLARLGGDEFAVLHPSSPGLAGSRQLAERITAELSAPVVVDGARISVKASVGLAVSPDHANTLDELLQRADIALYQAKENRGEVQEYRWETDQHTLTRLTLLADLDHAAANSELFCEYQPLVDARDGRPVAVEALLRWRHPTLGLVPPDSFIPLAENTGAIGTISRWVVDAALADLAALRSRGHDLSMAVNLSARLLTDDDLSVWLADRLRRFDLPASRLTIEVTESTIAADPTRAMAVLQRLRDDGVRVAIDDFGTGYSSLAHLGQLKPDELKVDRSFVKRMSVDETSAAIVRSTIQLAHGLGLSVVAEGVESLEMYAAVLDAGSDRVQGFGIAPPMPFDELLAWLSRAVPSAEPALERSVS